MAARRRFVLVVASLVATMGASHRTANFLIEAPTPEIARQVGQYAEHYRREKALLWLGHEMPPWPQPCPVRVTVTMNSPGGATSFVYDQGQVLGQDMHIEGPLERLLNSVLPHEVTHTVFAYQFRRPVPRWADEGGAVLSEDEIERNRHDMIVRQIVNTPGRAIPLQRLFAIRNYPHDMRDVESLYAEGYSVVDFLVARSNRPAFLVFLDEGTRTGWDHAVQTHYHFNSVNELEQAWLDSLRKPPRRAEAQVASSTGRVDGDPTGRIVERRTVPPVQPLAEAPGFTARGQMPEPDMDRPRAMSGNRPGTMPDYLPPVNPAYGQDRWQPAPPAGSVRLGAPQPLAANPNPR
jgi:hypothetical protein